LLRVEEGSSCLQMRRELLSDDGDPFTIMNMYVAALALDASRMSLQPNL
jgi:hypothetical protein